MSSAKNTLISVVLVCLITHGINAQENGINLRQIAPAETIVYFNYDSAKIATNGKYVELWKESFDKGLAPLLNKVSEEDREEFNKVKDSLKDIFSEINSAEGAFYINIKTTTAPDQGQETKVELAVPILLELNSVTNFQNSIESALKETKTITKESDVLSQTETWKFQNDDIHDVYVSISFFAGNKALITAANNPNEHTKLMERILSDKETRTEDKMLGDSSFNKFISRHTGSLALHFNFNYLWANMGSIMQAAMEEARGPVQMFLPLIVNVLQTIYGDIGYAGFTLNLNSNTMTQNFLIDFNSPNHGVFGVFNGNTKQTGIHVPDNCSFYLVSHFSYSKLWEIAQNVVNQFAPMMGNEPMDLNELIKQNTGQDANDAIINNLSPLILVYTLSSAKDFIPVVQLPASSPEKLLGFITSVVATGRAMSGEEKMTYSDTTISGKKGILLPLPEVGKSMAIVHDAKSVYIGLESTLNEMLPQIGNTSEIGCACCKEEFKNMIPQNSSQYFFVSHHFMTQYTHFMNELATKHSGSEAETEKMKEFSKWYKEFITKFKSTSYGYGKFDGDTYIFTTRSTLE